MCPLSYCYYVRTKLLRYYNVTTSSLHAICFFAAAARRMFPKVYMGAIGETMASVMDSSLSSPTSELMEDTRQVNRLGVIRS